MTDRTPSTDRSAFEAWLSKHRYSARYSAIKEHDGVYQWHQVQMAWEAWQAAQSAEPCGRLPLDWTAGDLENLREKLYSSSGSALLAGEGVPKQLKAEDRQFIRHTCTQAAQLIDDILRNGGSSGEPSDRAAPGTAFDKALGWIGTWLQCGTGPTESERAVLTKFLRKHWCMADLYYPETKTEKHEGDDNG